MPIAGLSGLRGLAIIIIVVYHLNQLRPTEGLATWNWTAYQFVSLLPVVVSIFFILGGFLRSLSYWKVILGPSERQNMDGFVSRNYTIPDFWKGVQDRFWRIAPMYYLALVISFVYSLLVGSADSGSFFMGFTFLSWVHASTFFPVPLNGPLWFVVYDMMGNIIVMVMMSALIYFIRKSSLSRDIVIGGGFIMTFMILLFLHFLFVALPHATGSGVVAEWFPYYNPFIFGTYYVAGAGLAGVYLGFRGASRKHIFFDFLFFASVGAIVYYLSSILGASDLEYSYPRSPYRYPLVPILFGIGILSMLFSRYIAHGLDTKFLCFIASISYPLYLFHALIIDMLRRIFFDGAPLSMGQWWILSIGSVGLSLIIAYTLTRLEQRTLQKK